MAGTAVNDTQRRLDYAGRLLTEHTGNAGLWPRCSTWLLRLALEHAISAFWLVRQPELLECNMRAQLLALHRFIDQDTAHRTSALWHTLSYAAHHHDYELAPTVTELRNWHQEATHLCINLTAT